MPSDERFVTLLDSNFLPQGLALAESLGEHCPEGELWILCMDEEVERSLTILNMPNVRRIPLREVEDARLLTAKADRSAREYCWTLTAFTFDTVFKRCPGAKRVTFVDADLYFFGSPRPLLAELEQSEASILVTEHNFDPEYDKSEIVGRFCVQFLTMDTSEKAKEVRSLWQKQVLEWCYDRREPERFGDQKYLDSWPALYGKRIHVLEDHRLALAPWNVRMEATRAGGLVKPAFYHFHSFRITAPNRARSVEGGYKIPRAGRILYRAYAAAVGRAMFRIEAACLPVHTVPLPKKPLAALRRLATLALGRADVYVRIRRSA